MVSSMNPIKIKNVTFKNRVVMAPMVRFGLSAENGIMGQKLVDHYKKRANTGIGLMITQALSVNEGKDFAGGAGAYSEDHISYLADIRKTCHDSGTRLFAQLIYPGFAYYDDNSYDINKISKHDLIKIRDGFIRGAEICKKAGLDGIEMHGAHSFFLNMMSSPISNHRIDKYGGDINGRLLLVKEIVEGIRSFADDDFIISYRMGWNDRLDTDIEMAKVLEKLGIELLHISSGIPKDRRVEVPENFPFNNIIYTGTQVKKHVNVPVIVVNDIRTLNRGNYLLEHDMCDFIAYGKPFLADEKFMIKSLVDGDYKACLGCKQCQWYINGEKCPVQIKAQNGR